jgi:apolipoprotein D and lipocalin family protein
MGNSAQLPDSLDLEKYSGTWYEIGRKPLVFQDNCKGAIAVYTLNKDRTLGVINKCLDSEGNVIRSRNGIATPTDISNTLLLRFTDPLPSLGESPYTVLYTDYDNISIVTGSNEEYLWLLSRTKTMSKDDAEKALELAITKGATMDRFKVWKNRIL